ncbi:hypothetical protein [Helicobacter sp. T3_23-1056]
MVFDYRLPRVRFYKNLTLAMTKIIDFYKSHNKPKTPKTNTK